jgi:hypothetical protein
MIGIEITLHDGTTALGVIFPDDTVYVHNPISDSYASQEDVLEDLAASSIQILGAIMPLEKVLEMLRDNHDGNLEAVERNRAMVEREFEIATTRIKHYINEVA